MGELTAQELITEGGLLAGRDDLGARLAVQLPMWLDSVAVSWPWPMLKKTATGLALPAGSTYLSLGRTGLVTDRISRIIDNVWCYTSDFVNRQRVRIRSSPSEPTNSIRDTTVNRGMPTEARVSETSAGVWRWEPSPVPDVAYLLALDYSYMPTWGGLSAVPWYPNDATIMQAVAMMALAFADGPDQASTRAQQAQVNAMLAADRIRFGQAVGENDTLKLNLNYFR